MDKVTAMNILGIIPARGGSKGLKDKNILKIHGEPLVAYTVEAALKAFSLNRVVVSTDSKKISDVVKRLFEIEVIKRPKEIARDDSPIEEALLHAVEFLKEERGYAADMVVWLQPNVPIRPQGLIDRVVKKLVNSDADSCVTCYEINQTPEIMKVINKKGRLVPLYPRVRDYRRQDFAKRFLLDGSVVAIRAKNLYETRGVRKVHVYLGKEILPVVQKKREYSIEIDTAEEVPLVTYYLKTTTVSHLVGVKRGLRNSRP